MTIPVTGRGYWKAINEAKKGKHVTRRTVTPALRALRRAALVARKTARMYGTPIYIWRDGKVVAEKP